MGIIVWYNYSITSLWEQGLNKDTIVRVLQCVMLNFGVPTVYIEHYLRLSMQKWPSGALYYYWYL